MDCIEIRRFTLAEFGAILKTYDDSVIAIENSFIQFVRRQTNPVAYCLTKTSRFDVSPHYFDIIPNCIHYFIMNEMR